MPSPGRPTVANRTAILTNDNSGWNGHTLRFFIPADRVLVSGDQVWVLICAGPGGLGFDAAYINHGDVSGSAFDPITPAVALSTGNVSLAANERRWFGPVTFNCIAGKRLGVDLHVTSPGSLSRSNVPDGYQLYFKSGNVAGQANPSGFSAGGTDLTMVGEVDVPGSVLPVRVPDGRFGDMLARPVGRDCLAGTVPVIPPDEYYLPWEVAHAGHARQQETLRRLGGVIACFGDSGMNSLCPEQQWSIYCQNFGGGGSTLTNLLNKLDKYTCLHTASGVIANPGINDIITSTGGVVPNVGPAVELTLRIFNWLSGPLIWLPVCHTETPSQHATIDAFNAGVRAGLVGRPNTIEVDLNPYICDSSGILLPGMMAPGENEHLSADAQAILAPLVRAAIRESGML